MVRSLNVVAFALPFALIGHSFGMPAASDTLTKDQVTQQVQELVSAHERELIAHVYAPIFHLDDPLVRSSHSFRTRLILIPHH